MNLLINDKVSYFLNIAVFGLAFSIAALWSPDYFYYGLVTFIYGISGHVIDNAFHLLYGQEEEGKSVLDKNAQKKFFWWSITLFILWFAAILIKFLE
ncbi:hypothetical protein KAW43_01130 [Candidatus Parcubacteria bacterium]|nr:hypothetical protein [Candidatus Parcubacteria bacterium]